MSFSKVGDCFETIGNASQSLAQGASRQAASLEETSASPEDINAMVRESSTHSRSDVELVQAAEGKFASADQSLNGMLTAIDEISTASQKVSKIIKVIEDIAFQTNILARNAAVEAARAGEAGMGFAVVAEEVRSLSMRCSTAARDTTELIEESLTRSSDGKIKVNQVAETMRSAVREFIGIKTLVEQIKNGSQEQARGLQQIGKAIVEMERVTQESAAAAEESASASVELTSQSVAMKDLVEQLTMMV